MTAHSVAFASAACTHMIGFAVLQLSVLQVVHTPSFRPSAQDPHPPLLLV